MPQINTLASLGGNLYVPEAKEIQTIATVDTTTDARSWYQQNGYRGISGSLGFGLSADQSFQVSAFLGGVKLISEDMGTLSFDTYIRSKDKSSMNLAYGLSMYSVLHDLPNPYMSSGEFVEAMTAQSLVYGESFARIDRSSEGDLIYLWPFRPGTITKDKDRSGNRVYVHRDGAESGTYYQDRIFNLRGMTTDGYEGLNTLRVCRKVIGLALDQAEYASNFFLNDHTPGIVLEHPGKIGDKQAVKNVKDAWKTSVKSGDVAVTQEGMKVNYIGQTNTDSQLREQREFQLDEIARILRIPPHKLANLARSTNNNIEQQAIEYITQTLNPWVRRWRQTAFRCLLTRDQQLENRIFSEHDVNTLQRGDFRAQSEGFARLLEKGVYSINQVRRILRMNPIEGGDAHFIQLNMQTVVDAATGANLDAGNGVMKVGA